MGINVTVTGVEDFVKSVTDVPKVHLQRTVRKYGAELQKQAQMKAPVDTGFLKQHIQPPEILDDGMTAQVVASAKYSAFLEYGTRKMNAKPYMKPALNSIKESFVRELTNWK